jgi:hypothetical protein
MHLARKESERPASFTCVGEQEDDNSGNILPMSKRWLRSEQKLAQLLPPVGIRFRCPPASFSGCWSCDLGMHLLCCPHRIPCCSRTLATTFQERRSIENKASDNFYCNLYCWTRSTRTRPSRGRSRGKTGWSGCPR